MLRWSQQRHTPHPELPLPDGLSLQLQFRGVEFELVQTHAGGDGALAVLGRRRAESNYQPARVVLVVVDHIADGAERVLLRQVVLRRGLATCRPIRQPATSVCVGGRVGPVDVIVVHAEFARAEDGRAGERGVCMLGGDAEGAQTYQTMIPLQT